MNNQEIKRVISNSADDFFNIVFPNIQSMLGGGVIVPVETVTDKYFTEELDTLAGIDAWQIENNRQGLRGIASRVQWGERAWNTFTIRKKTIGGGRTEYEKRLFAIQHEREGYIYPSITIQAYLDILHGKLLSAGIIHTTDLFELLEAGHYQTRINPKDGNEFVFIDWPLIIGYGIEMHIWPKEAHHEMV